MGLDDKTILSVGSDVLETTFELIKNLVDDDSELISIYYGEEVSEDSANELSDMVSKEFPDLDVELNYGGQPIYYYVLSVE